jgi:hypothetical protein
MSTTEEFTVVVVPLTVKFSVTVRLPPTVVVTPAFEMYNADALVTPRDSVTSE